MNIHAIHMPGAHRLGTHGAEARPISRGTGLPVLDKVVVESEHPDGRGLIHLSPDQALYVHSRLSHVTAAFLHGHPEDVHRLGTDHLPDGPVHELRKCGARVWPIVHEAEGSPPALEQVVVESEHPDGHGTVHLSPEQARYLHGRLTHITLAFLHENAWGGEDARMQ
jgi:hypothetical protein